MSRLCFSFLFLQPMQAMQIMLTLSVESSTDFSFIKILVKEKITSVAVSFYFHSLG